MIIKENVVITKAISKLYNELRERNYGEDFSWEELQKLSGLPDNTDKSKLYYIANKVCLLLMMHDQKYLDTVYQYGKRIVKPAEHTSLAKAKAKQSVKIYRRAGQILNSTNMDDLTDEQKNEVLIAANKYNTLEMFASELIRRKSVHKTTTQDLQHAGLFLDTINFFTKRKS